MKKILFTLFTVFTVVSYSQQISLHSQYLFNDMLINAGATGRYDYIPIHFDFRKQWANFPGAPTTQTLSASSKIAKNMGIGGTIYNDVSGPSRLTGFNFNGAYHLRLDARNRYHLGLGLGVSLAQHYIDIDKITTYLPNDPSVKRGYNNKLVPDANFGAFFYYLDKAYVGISGVNLIQSKRDLFNFDYKLFNPLARTYYLYGGYNFTLGKKSKLKTSTLFQAIETGTFQWDISMIYEWNNLFWVGGSYRLNDAAVAMVGFRFNVFSIGYSYDFTLSDIRDYSVGSHELFLELQLNRKNGSSGSRTPWLKRNRIYSPKF